MQYERESHLLHPPAHDGHQLESVSETRLRRDFSVEVTADFGTTSQSVDLVKKIVPESIESELVNGALADAKRCDAYWLKSKN